MIVVFKALFLFKIKECFRDFSEIGPSTWCVDTFTTCARRISNARRDQQSRCTFVFQDCVGDIRFRSYFVTEIRR